MIPFLQLSDQISLDLRKSSLDATEEYKGHLVISSEQHQLLQIRYRSQVQNHRKKADLSKSTTSSNLDVALEIFGEVPQIQQLFLSGVVDIWFSEHYFKEKGRATSFLYISFLLQKDLPTSVSVLRRSPNWFSLGTSLR